MFPVGGAGISDQGDPDAHGHHAPGGDDAVGLADRAEHDLSVLDHLVGEDPQGGSLLGEEDVLLAEIFRQIPGGDRLIRVLLIVGVGLRDR